MLRSARFGVAWGLFVATSCGGESERAPRKVPASVGGRAQAGKGGESAGRCAACEAGTGGRGGTSGGAGGALSGGVGGAAGSGGTGTGAGRAQGGTSSIAGTTSAVAGAGGMSVSGSGGSDDAGKGGTGGGASGGSGGDAMAGMAGEAAFDDSLAVTKVAVYQAVESTLFEQGSAVAPNATIVADREALVRVWLGPGKDFGSRSLTAELSITVGGSTDIASTTFALNGASEDDDLASTASFELNSTDVTDTTLLSLVIRDAGSGKSLTRWPASGEQVLAASSSKGPFQITMVPLVAGGYTPDLSAGPLSRFSRYIGQLYPASSVELTVRDPVTLSVDVQPDGDGWDEALDALLAVRDADDPEPQVYYYGVLTPGATMDEYCSVDCVVGLSNVAAKTQAALRGAIGTGYFESSSDTFSQETLGHELGHALGREHSPCGGADYPDPDYPYRNAFTGVWGYSGRNLLDPGEYRDVMSYCEPVWISDYTWNAIFTRISYVNGIARRRVMPRSERPKQRTLIVGQTGLRWGSERSPAEAPDGEPVSVELLDGQGGVIDDILVPFAPFDHLPGGFLSVPVDELRRSGAASVRVGDAVLAVTAN